ncbi:hypothetical protein [Cetobacterium sp.]|uniref:hypothetical protein n=1 Tax=Cetobacterium sp. TaxID=2071632 RepID=UPI003F32F40B
MFKNFKRYIPENSDPRILFIKSECGKDWYECQKEFSEETIKIMVNSDLKIISASQDVSMLFPENCSVYEVKNLDINEVYLKELYFLENKVLEKNIENREIFIKNKLITIETEKEKAREKRKELFKVLDLLESKILNKRIILTLKEKDELSNWYKRWLELPNEYKDINIPIEKNYPLLPKYIKYLLGVNNGV